MKVTNSNPSPLSYADISKKEKDKEKKKTTSSLERYKSDTKETCNINL
jgi:hypothetical protein